ncbi:MAG TPA: dihydroneopterin aldolase [Gemmatimonadaceae bacterium]|nr:dihydroneopterin aldolase [Gemmatimonadaceae bacterium]
MHEISLRGMRFHALVGILPHERTLPQPIEVDLTAKATDGEVIDYRALYDLTASVFSVYSIDYLEEIGDRIASGVLAHSPRIRSVRVAVRKPHVSLPGPVDHAEVVVERGRG